MFEIKAFFQREFLQFNLGFLVGGFNLCITDTASGLEGVQSGNHLNILLYIGQHTVLQQRKVSQPPSYPKHLDLFYRKNKKC